MDKALASLAEEVEAALALEIDLADRALDAINDMKTGIDFARPDLESTDRILALIYHVRPGWNVAIRGSATSPNGHWRCTLRKSLGRDNDEYVGIGRGPTLPHSLLASLLKVLSYAPRGG